METTQISLEMYDRKKKILRLVNFVPIFSYLLIFGAITVPESLRIRENAAGDTIR